MSKNNNLDFDLLRTFIAVVDTGSLTRAAIQLHRTQSAISMQIKRLESQLNQNLFQREGRGLSLTHQGKSLVSYARRLLNLHDQALNDLTIKEVTTHLRVGCPDDYSLILLPKLISLLRTKNPDIRISVYTANSGQLRQAMDDNEIDLAILTRLPNSNEGALIYQDQGVWVAKSAEEFKQRPLPLVLFEASCKFHSSVIDGLEKGDISYDLICDASHVSLLSELVRQGKGVSVMPRNAVAADLVVFEEHMLSANILPELPVAEVIVSLKGAEQFIAGWNLTNLAKEMSR